VTAGDGGLTTLLLWRHGSTEWNGQERIQGHIDTPLNDLGRAQAAAAAPLLAAREPAAIVSSDLGRCLDTAAVLAQVTGLPVRRDARLRERYYGEWQGLSLTEVEQRFPAASARKRAGEHELGHGIEPTGDIGKRVGEALRAAADAAPGQVTVVVTHSGSARYGMFDLLGWPAEQLRSVVALVNCQYSELRLDPRRGWMLAAHNVGSLPSVVEGRPGYE